jgi:ribosomal-protein-alanine N-acetyltransferase
MTVVLETERLILREWDRGDADVLFEMCSDPDVMRHIGDGRPWTDIARAHLWLDRVLEAYSDHGFGRLAVVEKTSGHVIGSCGFGARTNSQGIDFGYVFARSAWGRGYATEAAQACLRLGFERFGFAEVGADTDLDNFASRRVLEKIGFEFRGLKRYEGDEVDSTYYVALNPLL